MIGVARFSEADLRWRAIPKVEALSAEQTPLINTLQEASEMVTGIANPAVRSMLGCSSAGATEQRFAPLFAALKRHGYAGDVAVEPFDYVPDGPAAAARAIGYIRGILEAIEG